MLGNLFDAFSDSENKYDEDKILVELSPGVWGYRYFSEEDLEDEGVRYCTKEELEQLERQESENITLLEEDQHEYSSFKDGEDGGELREEAGNTEEVRASKMEEESELGVVTGSKSMEADGGELEEESRHSEGIKVKGMDDLLGSETEKWQLTAAATGEVVLEVVYLEDLVEKAPTQRFATAEMERKKKETSERDKIREGKETGRIFRGRKDSRVHSQGRLATEYVIWSKIRGKPVGSKKRAAELASDRQRAAAMDQEKKGLPQ